MTAVLGVSAYSHEAAAALVVDGVVVAAIAEERLSRVKNDASLPVRAMRACLALGEIAAGDLDEIVFFEDPFRKLEHVLVRAIGGFPRTGTLFARSLASQLGEKIWVLDALAAALEVPRGRVTFGSHHQSHAASAFFTSGEARAAILTVDGVGEDVCTAIWLGEGTSLRCLAEQRHPCSLGLLYAAFTAHAGFAINEGEQKLMGLAAYGTPRFRDELSRVAWLESGALVLDGDVFDHFRDPDRAFGPRFEARFGPARRANERLRVGEPGFARFADLAATIQAFTEDTMMAFAREAKARTGADVLCLAGGVALNAVANARLGAIFERVFVHPAAGDAGAALGAALFRCPPKQPQAAFSATLGRRADETTAWDLARALGLEVSRTDDAALAIARALEHGELVAVVDGRSEWGPRALGHRSLLAPAGPVSVRERLHRAVKEREPFRPFAPAAGASVAAARFDGVSPSLARFMTGVARARDPHDPALGAVVHVDGTARLQLVEDDASLLARVLALVPGGVVLNTSLNAAGEPLCESALDAIAFFQDRPIDALVIGDVIVRRPGAVS